MAETALAPRRADPPTTAVGIDKAATFLVTLGSQAAAEVLRHLSEQEVRQLSAAMTRLRTIRREQAAAVHEEAWRWLSSREGYLIDGERFVRELAESGPGSGGTGREQQVLREVARGTQASGRTLGESLGAVTPSMLAQMLAGEHPQVIAFILAHLPPRQAADVLAALPEDLPADLVQRIAELTSVPAELLAEVGAVLRVQVEALGGVTQGEPLGGAKLAADIMNVADKTVGERIFSHLDEQVPELSEQIRNLMLTFEDLLPLDNRGMQTLLKEVPREDLLLALKTASPKMRDKIFTNMSARASEILKDDLGSMGPVKLKEVEKAQGNIVAVARRLAEEQRITLGGSGDDAVV